MNPEPAQAPSATPAPLAPAAIAVRLGLILVALCAVIARRFIRQPHLVALTVPLWTRLNRANHRFQRLMTRLAAGRLPKPRKRQPTQPQPTHTQPGPQPSAPGDAPRPATLPRGRSWLVRAIGYEAAAAMSQLDFLLSEPGVADLIAATPAAARILRPIAHMLGCNPIPALALPRRPAKPRPARPPKPVLPPLKKHRPHHPRTNPHPFSFRTPARLAAEPAMPWLPWPPAKTT